MHTPSMPALRQLGVAVRAVVIATVLLGIVYPLVVTGLGRVAFPAQAAGSLVRADGRTVGSSLIGQAYTRPATKDGKPVVDADGKPVFEPDPTWFQTRPSAVDDNGLLSGASQLGPNSTDLVAAIEQRRAAIAAFEGVAPDAVPADAVTSSGSGLDPDISPAYAELQVARVARNRNLAPAVVRGLVEASTRGRTLGFLGEPRVDVVDLNVRLANLG